MKQYQLRPTLLLLATLAIATQLPAQERGTWSAASSSARSITGDLVFAPEKLTINFAPFPIAEIRPLLPAELKAAFDLDGTPNGIGHLYKLSVPGTMKFVRKNSLCAGEDTQWMATYVVGKQLQLALFSGAKAPTFTPESISTSTTLCGIYGYSR